MGRGRKKGTFAGIVAHRCSLFWRLVLVVQVVTAQVALTSVAFADEKDEDKRPGYKVMRYQEDYRFLESYKGEKDFFDPIKYIRLGPRPDIYLSVGGQGRSRYEYFRNPGFGEGGETNDFVLFRAQLHVDLHMSEYFRAFAQVSTLHALDPDTEPSPLDENDLAIQQAFGEGRLPLPVGGELYLRLGRQEVVLGSGRLVAIRKGPNFRRSFDMARLAYEGDLDLSLMAGTAVRPEAGVFDDGSDYDDVMWSAYGTVSVLPEKMLSLDTYYLGVRREARAFEDAQGTEYRHSLGVRAFGLLWSVDYNFEGILQFGTVGDSDLLAWTVASDTGYAFSIDDFDVRVGVKANVTSGDRTPEDGKLGTFDALYPNLKYFSEAGLIMPSNLLDFHPAVSVAYGSVKLVFDWDVFWRYSTRDAVYGPPGFVSVDVASSDGRFIGHQAVVELTLEANRHTYLTFYYVHFFRGEVLQSAGRGSVDFFGTWIELIF